MLAREIDRHRLPVEVEVVSDAEFVAEVDGIICWRRLDEWNRAGVWQRLHELLLAELRGAGQLDWSRAVIDSSHVRAARRGPKVARARSTAAAQAPSTTS
jgi:hypothetical protein